MAMNSIDFAHAGITAFHFPSAEFVSGFPRARFAGIIKKGRIQRFSR
jgi:hypothetical protein